MRAQRVLKSCDYRSINGERARFHYVRCPAQRWVHKALFCDNRLPFACTENGPGVPPALRFGEKQFVKNDESGPVCKE